MEAVMSETTKEIRKISPTNTKQEMLEAYNTLLKQIQERDSLDLKPEVEMEKKRVKETLEITDSLSSEGVVKSIGNLRLEVGKMLTQLSDHLEEEVNKYRKVKEAIEIKNKELEEIYGIDKAAQSLAALIEAQSKKRQEFETEMTDKRAGFESEIQAQRLEWEKEKKLYEIKIKERDVEDAKARQRQKEEYEYAFKREQQLAWDKFADEKAQLEKEIQLKKETVEKQLAEREQKISNEEKRIIELQKKVDNFPKEIEIAVQKATKETVEKVQLDARNKEEFLKKSFEGEKNVFIVKIESLEQTVKEQKEQISKSSQQLEKAYQKVEDIAVKSVGSFSDVKSLIISEQIKKQSQEK